jgi:HAD superfamily hydrolase (TIGR01509 family)
MRPGLIIFDCDGVLVDSEIVTCRVDARELGRLGFKISADEVAARFIGRPTQDMLTALEAEQGIPVPEGFREHLLACVLGNFATDLVAVPNMAAALQRISLPLCVASSSDVARIDESLRLTSLIGFFAPRIFSAQMVSRGKPFPDLFLLAARTLETAPARCLVIEDSTRGVEAAIAAGMRVYGYTGASHCQDGHAARLQAAGAALAFDDMAHLPELIGDLGRQS